MIIFSPHYPRDYLPEGAPKIAIIDDRRRRGWRLICQLVTETDGEIVIIPRTVSDHFLQKSGLTDEVLSALRAGSAPALTSLYRTFIDEMRTLHQGEVEKMLQSVDAVILPGNEYDVPPSVYGASEVHPHTRLPGPLDFRFETERLMAVHALANKIPLLGICGGFQLLVTLTGGQLMQHLPDILKDTGNVHESFIKNVSEDMLKWMECDYVEFLDDPYKPCPVEANHPIAITDGSSELARIALQHFGTSAVPLSAFSIHHQGALPAQVNTEHLKITALAPDGVVEAVEHVSHPFCIAVQFHPEYDIKGLAMPLIRELMSRCGK